jgi:hypothetical protein
MSHVFRPASFIVGDPGWSSPEAKFVFRGIPESTISGVLRQWALTPHLRAEIMRLERSVSAFAKKHQISPAQLKSMLNGHRLASFDVYSYVLETIGEERVPNEEQVRAAISEARKRSEIQNSATSATVSGGGKSAAFTTGRLGGWGDVDAEDVGPVPHPASALICAVLANCLLADPAVRKHLGNLQSEPGEQPADLEIELSAYVAPPLTRCGAEGFITEGLIAGRVRVPANWVDTVYAWYQGEYQGVFIARIIEGTPETPSQFTGVHVVLENDLDEPDIEFREFGIRVRNGKRLYF